MIYLIILDITILIAKVMKKSINKKKYLNTENVI